VEGNLTFLKAHFRVSRFFTGDGMFSFGWVVLKAPIWYVIRDVWEVEGYTGLELRREISIRHVDLGDVNTHFIFEAMGAIKLIKEKCREGNLVLNKQVAPLAPAQRLGTSSQKQKLKSWQVYCFGK
jgi:hypothetical protein